MCGGGGGDINHPQPKLIVKGHMYVSRQARLSRLQQNGRQSQTLMEINRILYYTKLLIKIFAQILGA